MFFSGHRVTGLKWTFCVGLLTTVPLSAQLALGVPTFDRDIAPIIFRNCSGCHQVGQPGPFPLLTYADVKRHARQIVTVTRNHYMPPWLPEAGYGQFEDERRLSDKQIHTIAAWVAAGEKEGSEQDLPARPALIAPWQLGKPDLIVTAAAPFVVPASGSDVFWNFTFNPALVTSRYVRAIEIKPGGLPGLSCTDCSDEIDAVRIVHHANVVVDRTGSATRREIKPGEGFPGMEVDLSRNPLDPVSHFLFWKPGSAPYSEPDGLSWRLDPGNRLVLNAHLQPSGNQQRIQPSIGLYFTDRRPTRFPLLLELENDNALDIPAGERNFTIRDNFRLPLDVQVIAIYPHAHYLGKLLEAYAILPDKKRVWLIRIPDWNPNWQAVYRYSEPIVLPKGTVLCMRFSYDNSPSNPRNPNRPPKRVEAGNRAIDEMGHLWLQVVPLGGKDRRRELQEALLHHRLDKVPNDTEAHLNLGALMMSRLETQGAIAQFQKTVMLDPSLAEAHEMLGSALRSVGRLSDALAQYQRTIRLDPSDFEARYDLATTLAREGKLSDALTNFQLVVKAFPNSSRLRNEWGEILARDGDFPGALLQFNEALRLDPSNVYASKNRNWLLSQLAKKSGQ